MRAVESVLPTLEALAPECSRNGQLCETSMRELRVSGLTSVFRPQSFMGEAVDLVDYLSAVRTLSMVAASTAWCLQIYNVTNWLIGCLFDDEVLGSIYRSGTDGLVSGSMVPNGPCEATRSEDGGYRLTGAWRFVSGCDYADWIFLKAPLPTESEPKAHILALVPRSACTIADDWHYAGLEGTGSKGISVDAAEVPAGFAVPFDDHVLESGAPAVRGRALPHFAIPSRVMMRLPITAVAVGVARNALRLFEENIREVRPNGFTPSATPSIQGRFAESELDVDLAERLLFDIAAETAERVQAGEPFPALLRARHGRDLVHAVHVCARAVDRLMAVSGARQMFRESPMQQAFRDIHAIACHHSCDRDRMMNAYARARLGLDPNGEVL